MSWQFWIPLLGLVPMLIIVGLLTWQNRRLDADERREAITTELRNLPATSVQKQRDELVDRQMSRMYAAMIVGLTTVMIILSRRVTTDLSNWSWLDSLAILTIVGCGIYYGRQIICEMPQGRRLRQAIRSEQATAQELANSLAGDNRIIHDVHAKGFNIDHVVITPAGVFAVETKSRLKSPAGSGASAVKVRYNGRQLEFPGWTETKPLDQASHQARWLANYLREATGESLPVFAVLALPGWFIENTARISGDMVRVINPKRSQWLLLPEKRPILLNAAAIQRAAFAIEKLAQQKEVKNA
jgi:hypothetical protein